ncbi:MAG: SprT family zinc-dependent metalloprotease [Sediminibacterium sp.]|nr:SprT family zinc-dependent metalloprotease [Sediminibacterium sp.]
MPEIVLGNIVITVTQKAIKNIHLSVHPPDGRVRIAAPGKMKLDTIRVYAISKLPWIKQQQKKIKSQKREAPREFITRESHYFLGKRYQLRVIELDTAPVAHITHNYLELYVRPGASIEKRKAILENWYREQLRELVTSMIAKWEEKMKVRVEAFGIKKMKTKWGTCNEEAKRIWLNFELAKKPKECIEYIVVHEMVHLKERHHNDRFIAYMNQFLPEWKQLKNDLNKLPVSHIDWGY